MMESGQNREDHFELKGTEASIIKALGKGGEPLSAYDISKVVDFSYPGVFKHCKKLKEKKMLNSKEIEGEKNSLKTIYSLTISGFAEYFLLICDDKKIDLHNVVIQSLKTFSNLHPINQFLYDLFEVTINKLDPKFITPDIFEFYLKFAISIFDIIRDIPGDDIVISSFKLAFFKMIKGRIGSDIDIVMIRDSGLKYDYEIDYLILVPVFQNIKKYPELWTEIEKPLKSLLSEWNRRSSQLLNFVTTDTTTLEYDEHLK